MRVAIFDTKHFEVAYTAMRFFGAGGNELFFFVSADLYRLFKEAIPEEMARHHWYVHDKPGEEKVYFDQLGSVLAEQSMDLLWISTLNNNYLKCAQIVRRARGTRVVMTVHNLNHWFGGKPPMRMRPLWVYLSRKWLLQALDGVCILEDGLARTLRDRYRYAKPVFVMPGLVYADALAETPTLDEGVRFVVPGGIEAKRRDYQLVLDAFEAAHALNLAVSLVLLGAPVDEYGREVLRRCADLRARGLQVRTYDRFVPQDEFHRQMKLAQVVLAPIQVETSFSGCAEVYGLTKSSGTMGDMIRYAKPGVVPQNLLVSENWRDAVLTYRDREGFIERVLELTGNRAARVRLMQAAHACAHSFTPEAQYHALESSLETLIGRRSKP